MGIGGTPSGSLSKRRQRAEADALSHRFADLLDMHGDGSYWPPTGVVGLEHEYRVHVGGIPVDFRTLVHRIELGQRHLDPADPNAYRLASGAALTADEEEAEIALAPIVVAPGFGSRVAATAAE